jgi:epoxyqueuosine reductase
MSELLTLKSDIKTEAFRLGFSHFGVAAPYPVAHSEHFQAWVREGLNADMNYLRRPDTLAKRADPHLILKDCQSVICLALPYHRPVSPQGEQPDGKGRVSAYARTVDYHRVIWDLLAQLEGFILDRVSQPASLKSYVDTGPILERSFATQAGIGIAGKNTCLIIQGSGSYFFLAEILTNLPLPVDTPYTRDLCGSCQRCIDACPTGCIRPDRTIDSARCISALTIEQKGIIPDEKKSLLGEWLFGCDICQMVCPHNSRPSGRPITIGALEIPEFLDLIDLFALDEDAFTDRYQQTPLARTKRKGLLRNAAIILGNQRFSPALPVLKRSLSEESDPGLIDACRWAIREIESSEQDHSKGDTQ